jgi:hypothetical protein
MFTVKHRLPYKSDVKGDHKGWLHTYFQTPDTIYLNKKGCQVSQLNKMRQMEALMPINKKNRIADKFSKHLVWYVVCINVK